MAATCDPRWPAVAAGPRVLVECDDAAAHDGIVRALQEQGFAVASCAGPRARSAGVCPLVDREQCGLVEEADVVVHALDPADPAHAAVRTSVHAQALGTPVVDLTESPKTRDALLAAVDDALGR